MRGLNALRVVKFIIPFSCFNPLNPLACKSGKGKGAIALGERQEGGREGEAGKRGVGEEGLEWGSVKRYCVCRMFGPGDNLVARE